MKSAKAETTKNAKGAKNFKLNVYSISFHPSSFIFLNLCASALNN